MKVNSVQKGYNSRTAVNNGGFSRAQNFSSLKDSFSNSSKTNSDGLYKKLNEVRSKYFFATKIWEPIKSHMGFGTCFDTVEAKIKEYERNETSYEEVEKTLNQYEKGQATAEIVIGSAGLLLIMGLANVAAPKIKCQLDKVFNKAEQKTPADIETGNFLRALHAQALIDSDMGPMGNSLKTQRALLDEHSFNYKKDFYPETIKAGINPKKIKTLVKSGDKMIERLPKSTKNKLDELLKTDPGHYKIVNDALKATYVQKYGGVHPDTFNNFVLALCKPELKPLLKCANKNNVHFNLMRSFYTAQYSESLKEGEVLRGIYMFDFGRIYDTINSLPHELSHVFDFNADLSKLNLTFEKMPVYALDKAGNYYKTGDIAPNARWFGLPAYRRNVSYSKEFEDAVNKDLFRMMEIEEEKGLRTGSTFDKLLKNKRVSYYFGVNQRDPKQKGFKQDKFKRELFAQLGAYATAGKTSKPEFDKVIEEFFPNALQFVKDVLPK